MLACIALISLLSFVGAFVDMNSPAKCPFGRHLLQAADDSNDFGDLAEDVSVFQEVSPISSLADLNIACIAV